MNVTNGKIKSGHKEKHQKAPSLSNVNQTLSEQTHTCDNEKHVVTEKRIWRRIVAIHYNTRVGSIVSQIQIRHVHSYVFIIYFGVLPWLDLIVCHVFSFVEPIHKYITPLQVEELYWLFWVIGAFKSHISTDHPPEHFHRSISWKTKTRKMQKG